MNKIKQSKWDVTKQIIHWIFLPYYIYKFAYAAFAKVFQIPFMMESMSSLGFNQAWTLMVGYFELIGWLMVVVGLLKPKIRVMGILLLLPFSIGAFTAHMAHQEYVYFYPSLIMCISSVVLLWSSRNFKMQII